MSLLARLARHRYEVNNAYRAELEKKAGIVFSGTSPDNKLVDVGLVTVGLTHDRALGELRRVETEPHGA
ncbi:hypothetical protein HRW22_11320, partial [Streptomyces lunaelactis]|nr:hypothetical protein [Streptomyces lunaelactis]